MGISTQTMITTNDRTPQSRPAVISSERAQGQQQGLRMLVLIAGADLDYCARVGKSLQGPHQVVMAADFSACRHFTEHASADAVILSTCEAEQVPAELVREIRERQGIPVVVLVEDERPEFAASYIEAGAECVSKTNELGDILRWVDASSH